MSCCRLSKKEAVLTVMRPAIIEMAKTEWIWGFISSIAAHFSMDSSRGKKVLRNMMSDFKSIIISDRYAAYTPWK